MERKVCMFTGHRTIATSDLFALPARLDFLIEKLINDGYTDFRCGGAQGFDTIAALKVLEKRKKYPHIKLHLFLPCKDQADRWSENARCAYFMILDAADSVRYEVDVYTKGCMHARNRSMVENCSVCVAFCSSSSGGTAYTVDFAQKNGVRIINLARE